MNIINFIRGLLPRFDKSRVMEELRVTISELEQTVIPSYSAAADYFKQNKLKSKNNLDRSALFYRNCDVSGGKQATFIGDIARRLEFIKANAEYVLESLEKTLEHDVLSSALNAQKALLIRAASDISFVSRYSLDLLTVIYSTEATERNQDVVGSVGVLLNQVTRVDQRLIQFARILSDYGIPLAKFEKLIGSVPEVIINDSTIDSLKGLYQGKQIDPMSNVGVSNFQGSPILWIKMNIAEWQAHRYKVNKEKKKGLELRLLHLKELQKGQNNPRLEKEIEYIQERVEKMSYEMNEMEAELA